MTFRYPNLELTKRFNALLLWLSCRTQQKKARYTQWDERGSAVDRSSGNVVMELLVYTTDLTTDIQRQALVFRWTVQISSLKASGGLNGGPTMTILFHINRIENFSSHLTVIICIILLSSFLSFKLKPKGFAKFNFFTVNNMVLSPFQKDQNPPLNTVLWANTNHLSNCWIQMAYFCCFMYQQHSFVFIQFFAKVFST